MVLPSHPEFKHFMRLEIWNAEEKEIGLESAHDAEKDLTGVHLAILIAGTHEDLWDNLMPSRLEEHALALLVAEDWHRDVLEDGRKNPTLAQSAPSGNGDDDNNLSKRDEAPWYYKWVDGWMVFGRGEV